MSCLGETIFPKSISRKELLKSTKGWAVGYLKPLRYTRQSKPPKRGSWKSEIRLHWLIVRVISVTLNGGWSNAFAFSGRAIWFWLELILVIVPALMVLACRYAKSESGIFLIGMLLLIGGGMYRIGVYNVGFSPGPEYHAYFPSLLEFLITVGFVAIEILGYMVLVKLTPVLPNLEKHGHKH